MTETVDDLFNPGVVAGSVFSGRRARLCETSSGTAFAGEKNVATSINTGGEDIGATGGKILQRAGKDGVFAMAEKDASEERFEGVAVGARHESIEDVDFLDDRAKAAAIGAGDLAQQLLGAIDVGADGFFGILGEFGEPSDLGDQIRAESTRKGAKDALLVQFNTLALLNESLAVNAVVRVL
jgi:hypothetical protein